MHAREGLQDCLQLCHDGRERNLLEAFLNKDLRRCEFELYKFFEAFCKNNVQAVVETEHSTGEPVMMLPSTRARLCQCNQDIELSLPMLDTHLVELYKLTMPLDRGCNPTTVAELKHRKVLPEHSTYNTLAEEEAKAVCEKLKEKYPKLAEIEFIPLLPAKNDQYENKHTKILRQIRAWNFHQEQVVKAQTTMSQEKAYRAKATAAAAKAEAEKAESIKAEYNAQVSNFWKEHDVKGQGSIKLANDIRKQWNEEAQSSKPKEGASTKKDEQISMTEESASIKKE